MVHSKTVNVPRLAVGCAFLFAAALFAVLMVCVAIPCKGQSWPLPAKQPNVAVPCFPPAQLSTGALCSGQLTAPYDPRLSFVGRYLDASATKLEQSPIRTLTAQGIRVDLTRDRLYMVNGGGLLAGYDLSRFVARLAAGEPLVPVTTLGGDFSKRHGFLERFLRFDRSFYAERVWKVDIVDGQQRLLGFDFDDRGMVAVAYDVYGWGLLDSNFQSVVQGDMAARTAILIRSGARYYLIATSSETTATSSRVYEVTVPSAPVRLLDLPFAIDAFAHLNNGDVALIDSGAHLRICTAAGLAMSLCQSSRSARTGRFMALDSDGVTVYALSAEVGNAPVAAAITVVKPGGDVQEIGTRFVYSGKVRVRVGAGYMVLFGTESKPLDEPRGLNARNLRLFRVSPGVTLSEIPLVVGSPQPGSGQFFKNYYHSNTTPGYVTPSSSGTESPGDVAPFPCDGELCLAVDAQGLADLWRVHTAASVPIVPSPPAPAPQPTLCPCPTPTPTPAPQPAPAPAPKPPAPAPCVCSREHLECCR